MRLSAALLLPLCTTAASAADMTVAGLTLGAPVVTKPCESKSATTEPCLLVDQVTQLAPDEWAAWMLLPANKVPQIMKPRSFKIYSKAGALVGVEFWTYGLRTQAWDIQDLTHKYGAPSFQERIPLANRAGANLNGIIATWALDGLSVSYVSWMASDEGRVTVLAPAGVAMAKAEEMRTPRPPKL